MNSLNDFSLQLVDPDGELIWRAGSYTRMCSIETSWIEIDALHGDGG